jgi:DNA invertase Pin-like site-specific DNA recombinase
MFIAYYRVSTNKQERSGLGLEAQKALVQNFAAGRPVIAEMTEIESGRNSARPVLASAMELAKQTGATLVVAKQDRLARKVLFIATLIESGVPFVIADNPHADKFRLHIEACINEEEAEKISQRTKAALAAAKARGQKLGSPNPRAGGQARAAQLAAQSKTDPQALIIVRDLKAMGMTSTRQIARGLSERGIKTTTGSTTWHPAQVSRLLQGVAA